jgi:predicted methyltransferase
MHMKLRHALALICLAPLHVFAAGEAPTAAAALADPARPPEQVALDPLRKPAGVLEFAGVKAGDRVADFMSGNGYFTRILSRVVGPTGHVCTSLLIACGSIRCSVSVSRSPEPAAAAWSMTR